MIKSLLIAILALFCLNVNAANIYKQQYENSDWYFIALSGDITLEDSLNFANLVRGVSKAIVILDSPGGSVLSGIEIGRLIKNNRFLTAVPSKTLCASSCALIWLAGTQRFAEDNSFVGFHAAYVYKDGKPVETGSGNALVGSYLNSLGLSDSAIVFVTNAPPEGIERLDRLKAKQYGIQYASINSENVGPTARKDIQINKPRYNPIDAVTRFYQALSVADGNSASAIVIPEKRGIGPFNEKNIASFFGNMRKPLKVSSVSKLDENTVRVEYSYQYTKTVCHGVATVETGYFMGNTLIKKIKANC